MDNKKLSEKGWEGIKNRITIIKEAKLQLEGMGYSPGLIYDSEMKPMVIDAKVFDQLRVERPLIDWPREFEVR